MRRPPRRARRLRAAIDAMPVRTRRAMLEAIEATPIIAGAYTDREGGACPMLAAHRAGGRTSFPAFARAWDGYARAGKGSRPATEHELRTLKAMLEASMVVEVGAHLAEGIAAHRAARRRREPREGRPGVRCRAEDRERARGDTGGRDRAGELSAREGWAWLRPVRGLDEYERALEELERCEAPTRRERQPA